MDVENAKHFLHKILGVDMLNLLKELCDACGVTGFEKEVGGIIAEKIKYFCDELYYDKAGNLIAFKKGKITPEKPVMYCAHMDEVGMMIKHINDDGTLLFDQVGMMPEVLPGKQVLVGKNKIAGVICSKPVHLIKDKDKGVSAENMYIDIGARSKSEAAKMGVYADYACFKNEFTLFGNGKMIRSKALDDRIGCAAMVDMIISGVKYDSYFVFSVGEEIGGVGAVAATREIKPGVCIVFESTTASDLPCNEGADMVCVPGNGPVCAFMDGGTMYDKKLYKTLREIAAQNGIPTQTKTKIAGGTDAASIQRSVDGVRVGIMSLACRYIHTSSCVAAAADAENYFRLAHFIDENMGELTGAVS